jgi:prepilin-type N-terminal cleavage/methylation domain-containing protein
MRQKTIFRAAKAGFTIVEITVVIAVIGILAGVIYARYYGVVAESYDTAILADSQSLDSAITNMANKNSGIVVFGDADNNDIDDGYHYTDATMNDPVVVALNTQLGFTPTRSNVIDAMVTSDGTEFCIRIYNPKSNQYKTAATAYQRVSNNNVTGGVGTCTHT